MRTEPTQKQTERPHPIISGLYLVSTPIGNLRDITLRALDTLNSVDEIYCEDTRVSGKLLKAYEIKKPLHVYNDHSTEKTRAQIIDKIRSGKAIALISDAGTPMISDPGFKLVRACHEAEIYVTTMPGANAPLSALQLSGFPSDTFGFYGFLPSKAQARHNVLTRIVKSGMSAVAFESANRIEKTLSQLIEIDDVIEVAIVREITKRYEEVLCGRPPDLLSRLREHPVKGEIVLVFAPALCAAANFTQQDIEAQLAEALTRLPVKRAAAEVAAMTGRPKKELYDYALAIRNRD